MKVIQINLNTEIKKGKIFAIGENKFYQTFNVDWNQYFGNYNGLCRLKVHCCSNKKRLIDYNERNCILKINFNTPYSNIDDCLVIGSFNMKNYFQKNNVSALTTAYYYYMELDTRQTNGITINRPTSSNLVVKCSNVFNDELFSEMTTYNLILQFEIDDIE